MVAMKNRSGVVLVLPCEPHRRSQTRLSEIQAMRRELARLDHIQDHVLDVVVDRLLDVLDLPTAPPASKSPIAEIKGLTLVHVDRDCVERTVDRGVSPAGV